MSPLPFASARTTSFALERRLLDLDPLLGEEALLDAEIERVAVRDRQSDDPDLRRMGSAGRAGRCPAEQSERG